MSKNLFLSIIISSILLSACGKNISKDSYTGSKEYEFTERNLDWSIKCSTDRHSFSSKKNERDLLEQYCQGLKDSSKNNNCAYDSRKDAFEKDCQPLNLHW